MTTQLCKSLSRCTAGSPHLDFLQPLSSEIFSRRAIRRAMVPLMTLDVVSLPVPSQPAAQRPWELLARAANSPLGSTLPAPPVPRIKSNFFFPFAGAKCTWAHMLLHYFWWFCSGTCSQGRTKRWSEQQGVAAVALKGCRDKAWLGEHWSKVFEKTDRLRY